MFWQKILATVTITALSFPTQMAVSQTQPRTMSDWCQQRDSLDTETQKTIDAIVTSLKVENCEAAAQITPQVFSLSIVNQEIELLTGKHWFLLL